MSAENFESSLSMKAWKSSVIEGDIGPENSIRKRNGEPDL